MKIKMKSNVQMFVYLLVSDQSFHYGFDFPFSHVKLVKLDSAI